MKITHATIAIGLFLLASCKSGEIIVRNLNHNEKTVWTQNSDNKNFLYSPATDICLDTINIAHHCEPFGIQYCRQTPDSVNGELNDLPIDSQPELKYENHVQFEPQPTPVYRPGNHGSHRNLLNDDSNASSSPHFLAVLALIFAILCMPVGLILCLIVLGSNPDQRDKKLAITGLIVCAVMFVLSILVFFFVFLPILEIF